uniref:Uncharacterized protein n=1 Tax=Aegilops tauschii subsp. strangulata TaxID=200361 RepID=A0A453BUN3_AEGTS
SVCAAEKFDFFPPVTSFYAVEARGRSIYVRRWIYPSPAPTSTPTEGEEDSAQLPPLPDPQAQHDVAGAPAGARALEEAESELLLVVEAPGGGAGGGGLRRVLGRAAQAVSPRRAQGATSGEQFRGGGAGLRGLQGVPVPLLQVSDSSCFGAKNQSYPHCSRTSSLGCFGAKNLCFLALNSGCYRPC